MYACLAVTCHLHFWQNDRDFLRATVVTRGWNGYRNKSQHRKPTLEKKILPPFQQGFEPATFQSRVRRSNHWAIPAPAKRNRAERLFIVLSHLQRHYGGKLANHLAVRGCEGPFSLLQLQRQCRWWGQRPRGRNRLTPRCRWEFITGSSVFSNSNVSVGGGVSDREGETG